MKNELKNSDHVQPQRNAPAESRLSMLRDTEEHNQMLGDQLLMKSLQGQSGFQSGFQPRGRARSMGNNYRGRGYQGNQRFDTYQSSGPRGRGRGRAPSRGYSRPRGRGGFQQPFSEPQSFKKQE